jgi:putative flavoprotein involved in K+ transport
MGSTAAQEARDEQRAREPERIGTLVIGGGQAGLSVGYHLAKRGLPFLILDARERIGDAWRARWDSLCLFTPARHNGLDGMPFPGPAHVFPTKNEWRTIWRSTRLASSFRSGRAFGSASCLGPRRFVVTAGARQLHSAEYRSPEQLREGPVLLVGAGNSGFEIAMEVASRHPVWMSGHDVGQIPFRIDGLPGRLGLVRLVLRVSFHRVLTVKTPIGRKVRPEVLRKGGPLIRVKSKGLARAGVERVPRVVRVEGGLPVLEDGRVLDPANVVWRTGFHRGFDWIDLPVAAGGEPEHRSGIVEGEPGLFFVGLHFLHAVSSPMIHGVGRDAARIASAIADRARAHRSESTAPSVMTLA